jgi:hypothetical protein
LNLTNHIRHIILNILAVSWLVTLALAVDIQPSDSLFKKSDSGTTEHFSFSQNVIIPVAESSISLFNYSFQQTPGKDKNNQFNDALLGYNLSIVCDLTQQTQWLGSVSVKYRQLVLLYPSHYFW